MARLNLEMVTRILTHGGLFHADDVFSAALLELVFEKAGVEMPQVERVFSVSDEDAADNSVLVFDIGGGTFDHHQADRELREDGLPYAAFGLLWREFGHELVSDLAWGIIEKTLVRGIDAADNGVFPQGEVFSISAAISSMNPLWNETPSPQFFTNAVAFAKAVLEREIAKAEATVEAKELAETAVASASGKIVVLPRFCPWQSYVPQDGSVLYVIFPSNRGGFNVQCVADAARKSLRPFPSEWRAKKPEDLAAMGVPATFVHAAGFMAACSTLEDARAVAELSMRKEE